MLKLRLNTEDWREQITGWTDCETLDEVQIDWAAERLQRDVLTRLADAGVDYERAYQQSVGTHVIVQAGTQAERGAFDAALETAMCEAREDVARRVAETAAAE